MSTESIFYIELLPNNEISFKLIGRDDLKIRIMPAALLNHISQGHLPFDLMRTVYRTIRNFENSPWDIAMRKRHSYYQEIEDKVHEQLSNWKDSGDQSKNTRHENSTEAAMGGQIKDPAGSLPILISRQKDEQQRERGHFQYGDDDDEKSRKGRWVLCLVIALAGFAFRQGLIDQLRDRHYFTTQNHGLDVMIALLALVTAAVFRQNSVGPMADQGTGSTTNVEGFGEENPKNRKVEVIVDRTPDTKVPNDSMDSRPPPQSQPQARQETKSKKSSKLGRRLKRLKKVFKRKRKR